MAVGRITGPLLSKNLLRDGVDLSFETDLLYLDVTTGRIGIKTATPQYALDVQGDTNLLALRVETTSTLGNLSVYSTTTTSYISNGVGNLVISAPTEDRILLNNNTLVSGNLHATGNITAEGSVQIGNNTGSDTLSLYADIVSDITPQTPGQYDLGAPGKEWAQGYIDSLVASALVGKAGGDVNITPALGRTTNINSNVRIWGDNPLGTSPVVQNVLYVTMDGSDTNDGRAMDPSRACRTITGAIRSPFYKEGTSIKVAPGRYFEDNPIRMKRLTSIIGSDLRTTFIEPINKTQDLFWVNSGCYLAQMQFSNGKSGLLPGSGYTAGTNRGAYATAFPPNYGGQKIDLFYSPYIQNCTNQSGPWLQDGTLFVPNSTVQIPSGVGTGTWVANTTTILVHIEEGEIKVGDTINNGPTKPGYINARTLMLANKSFLQEQVIAYIDQKYEYYGYDEIKCARDTGLIIDSIVADLVFSANGYTQSNFAGLQYWNQDGYTGDISNEITTTTNAINFVSTLAQEIVQNITTGTRYVTTASQTTGTAATSVEAEAIATDFTVITDILTNGTVGVTDDVQPNGIDVVSVAAQRAADLLQANRTYIQEQAIAYVEDTKELGFVYDPAKCYRDVGFMVDSVTFDILYGGNRQAIQSGVYYYGFSETESAIDRQQPQTTAAYFRIRQIAEQLLTNQTVSKSPGNISSQNTSLPSATASEISSIEAMIDLITSIISGGPEASLTPAPIGLTRSSDENVLNAAEILQANKSFIISEVIGFVEYRYNDGFTYNQPKCFRDTGLIVDSIATDLLYDGTTQSTFAGLQYWNQTGYTGSIETEVTATTAALNYLSSIAQNVVQNITSGIRYQSTVTQTTGTVATIDEVVKISEEFGIITNILNNGTLGVTDIIEPNGTASTSSALINAFTLLQDNKEYLQAEAIAFVNSQYQIFDENKCARDTGLIVDAIAQDVLFSTSSQSIFAGLQYWNQAGYTELFEYGVTTTTNAINFVKDLAQKIVVNDTSGFRYTTTSSQTVLTPATSAEQVVIGTDFDVITDIVINGTVGVTDIIVPNGISASPSPNTNYAYDLLQANRTYLQEQAIAYVDATKTVGFEYDPVLWYRDIGYIVDAVSFDLLYGGNRQAVQTGVYYYDFSASASAIAGEIANTIAAYNRLKELLPFVVQGISFPTPLQLSVVQVVTTSTGTTADVSVAQSKVDLITNIVSNGPSVVPNKPPIGLVESTNTSTVNAASLIYANREFLVAEVIEYISNPTNFAYDDEIFYSDIGYVIDSVCFDILNGGNRQAVQSGVYYYSFDGNSTAIENQVPQTTAAYNHIRRIVSEIITNQPITPTPGNTATQVTLSTTATSVEVLSIFDKIDTITNIINNGPTVASAKEPIGLTVNTDAAVQTAYDLLIANRTFIQSETIAFLNQFDTGFVYNRAKCARDIGIIIENISYDIAFGGNEKSVEAGTAYWDGVTSYISNEITETTDAFLYLESLAQSVITNTTATNLMNEEQVNPQVINTVLTGGGVAGSALTKLINIINDIIENGTSVAPIIQVGDGPDWGSVSAEVLLQTNRSFIQNEVISWISSTYPNLSYREDKCYRDTGLIVDAITQDIILNANAKSIEAGVTYWTGAVNVLENAKFGKKDQVVETVAAINRAKQISLQIINNTTVTTTSFVFDSTKCARDTGLIVDGLAQDLLFDGTSQSKFSGVQYWNHGSYTGDIPSQITTTTAAINYISSLAQRLVVNDTSGIRYQSTITQISNLTPATNAEAIIIARNFSTVTDILINGVDGVTDKIIPNNLTASGNINVQYAYNILQANLEYLKAEAIGFVDATKNFQYDETKCRRDSGIIVDSIVIDIAYPTEHFSQSTFSGLQYWNQNGYTGSIEGELTTTTNAINYVNSLAQLVIQNNTSGVRYQSSVAQVVNTLSGGLTDVTKIDTEFTLITTILTDGTDGVTDLVEANSVTPSVTTSTVNAYNLLVANREYIVAETIAYVEAIRTPGFTYDQTLCARDVGYMIDSVAFDLLHGGNRQAIQSGVYYYSFNGSSSAIPNEMPQTVAAFQFIKTLSANLVQNIVINPLQTAVAQDLSLPAAGASIVPTVEDPAYRIINIIENGPSVVGVKEPVSLTATSNDDAIKAANILVANRNFIIEETIAFLNAYEIFQYDPATCARDVGYIVNSVSFDLLWGGNRQSIQSGVYYWGYSDVSTSLPNERVASTLAYQYMKELIGNIVVANATATVYQSTVTQVTALPAATIKEVEAIGLNIDTITTIINDGPNGVIKEPIGLDPTDNQFVRNAVNLLSANRDFIVAEVIAYVEETQVSNDQIFLPFYDMGANATLSVIRNYDIITNIIQNGVGVAPERTDGGGIFARTGVSNNDVKIAPVVTAVTTVSSGVFQVDISESTIGFGDEQTLYFGETNVFPLQDPDVPARWQQRRINPIGSMGGALIDGGVISDRSPINSFVFDAYTQLNQGGNGVFITNNGYAQLVSVFTIFCSNAVTVENGGIASVTNSNSNFGDICLTAKGYGRRDFSGYIKNPPVLPFFPNGVYPSAAQVEVYIADPDLRPHISLVMEVEPPVGFINNQGLPGFLSGQTTIDVLTTGTIEINGIDNTGVVIGQEFYIIDQFGRQVDSNNQPYVKPGTIVANVGYQSILLNFPLNSGGGEVGNTNFFNLYTCGKAYYTVLSSVLAPDPIAPGTLLLPNQQNIQEALSLDYINTLSQLIVDNISVTPLSTGTQVFDFTQSGGSGANNFIEQRLNIIAGILENGPSSHPRITRTDATQLNSGPQYISRQSAASLLLANKSFIQDEVIAYVDETFFSFEYDQVKCARDTGLIVDSITQDLLFSTSSQATFAGIQYWNQSEYTGEIASQITTTTAAISFVKEISQQVVQGQSGTRYTTGTQITNLTLATPAQANTIGEEFDIILNILNTGTVGVTDIIIPNGLTASTNINIVRAYDLLQANKEYIQEETIAFIEATKAPSFEYTTATCYRDVGYMIDSVSFDLLYGGNKQAVQSGVYYYGYSTTSTSIANEIPQTVDAYDYIAILTEKIVLGQPITALQTSVAQVTAISTGTSAEVSILGDSLDLITNIIENGPSVVTDKTPISLDRSTSANVINAALAVDANREFIVAEVIAYINGKYLNYNKVKCRRDVGFIVDALVYDLEAGGNYNSVIAGRSYYAEAGTRHVVQLEENVTDPALFPDGAIVTFYQRSYISAAGYLFEYVGSGANYGALPQRGVADPDQTKEVVQLNNGKVFFTSTDQNGDFRIGTGLVISQATGVLSGRTFTKSLFANLTPFILAIEG
jgi:hypothetical protein